MKKFLTLIALFAMTLGVAAQTFYEWKDGKYTARSISEIDSITFSLPNVKTIPDNAVDLGLPSGTLWADRNVGADTPEDYGDYYAWGETSPKLILMGEVERFATVTLLLFIPPCSMFPHLM